MFAVNWHCRSDTAHASCLIPLASCLMPQVSGLMPQVSCLRSHASCLRSQVSRLVPRASGLLPHSSSLMPQVSCLMPHASSLMPQVFCLCPVLTIVTEHNLATPTFVLGITNLPTLAQQPQANTLSLHTFSELQAKCSLLCGRQMLTHSSCRWRLKTWWWMA